MTARLTLPQTYQVFLTERLPGQNAGAQSMGLSGGRRAWGKPWREVMVQNMPQNLAGALKEDFWKKDFWKDAPVGYLGYLNEMAESWEGLLKRYLGPAAGSRMFRGAQGISWAYAGVDATASAWKTYQRSRECPLTSRVMFAGVVAGEALLFQFLANYLIPTTYIRCVQALLEKGLEGLAKRLPLFERGRLCRLLIPALGCTTIVLFKEPVDEWVKKGLKRFYWPLMGRLLKQQHEDHLVTPGRHPAGPRLP